MGKEKRDGYRQWKKKMKIRGGGLHMAEEYDWGRNTAEGGGGGGRDEAITLQRTG